MSQLGDRMISAVASLVATFALALIGCAYLAPKLADAARRYGVVDAPDQALDQSEPVAYLGGLAVYISVLTALAVTLPIGDKAPNDLFDDPQVLGMLLGGTLFMAVGLLDDLTQLTPRDKLLGQLLACAVLIKAGVAVYLISLPQAAQVGLTVLWVLACCNAVNLVDVHDGLAASLSGLSALGFCVLGWMVGDFRLAVLAAAIAGAAFGFLRINRPPARQYLGDTGALFLGSSLAMLALMARYDGQSGWMPYLVPIALIALPFIEVGQLIVTRLRLVSTPSGADTTSPIGSSIVAPAIAVVVIQGALRSSSSSWRRCSDSTLLVSGAAQALIIALAAALFLGLVALPALQAKQVDDDQRRHRSGNAGERLVDSVHSARHTRPMNPLRRRAETETQGPRSARNSSSFEVAGSDEHARCLRACRHAPRIDSCRPHIRQRRGRCRAYPGRTPG